MSVASPRCDEGEEGSGPGTDLNPSGIKPRARHRSLSVEVRGDAVSCEREGGGISLRADRRDRGSGHPQLLKA